MPRSDWCQLRTNAMTPDSKPPEFQFDSPPPFSYEDFKTRMFPQMLGSITGPGADYLKALGGAEEAFLTRLFYLMIVVKIQNPDMTTAGMLYALNYGMVRYFLDQGQSPESAREELSKVPWDTLPGLDDYDRESANAVATRAFADAVAGRPQAPLH